MNVDLNPEEIIIRDPTFPARFTRRDLEALHVRNRIPQHALSQGAGVIVKLFTRVNSQKFHHPQTGRSRRTLTNHCNFEARTVSTC